MPRPKTLLLRSVTDNQINKVKDPKKLITVYDGDEQTRYRICDSRGDPKSGKGDDKPKRRRKGGKKPKAAKSSFFGLF